MRLLPKVVVLMFLALPLLAMAQQSYVPIEQRLTAEQMRETGLDTLSDPQLKRLNLLLSGEQVIVEERVESATRSRLTTLLDRKAAEPIRAAVKGEFRGWAPGREIELENGQRWRVTEGELYLRRPMQSPTATVSPGLISGWYLQVEGQSPRAKVQLVP